MTETEQRTIASNWFKLLNQGELDGLVALYSEHRLSFHPTLWNEHIHSHSRTRDYFVHLMSRKPHVDSFEGVCFDLDERSFLFTGTMKLKVSADDSRKQSSMTTRFSFIWVNERDVCWRIIHHHNSVVPSG